MKIASALASLDRRALIAWLQILSLALIALIQILPIAQILPPVPFLAQIYQGLKSLENALCTLTN